MSGTKQDQPTRRRVQQPIVMVDEPEQTPPPPVTAPAVPPPPPPADVFTPASAPAPEFAKDDVCQVIDRSNRHYGVYFTIGDIVRNKVHGYVVSEGQVVSFITVDVDRIHRIGVSKVRSAKSCSDKWLSDNPA